MTTICQSRYMLSQPVRVPNASDTQRNTPPDRVYVEASSAQTSAYGTRKTMAAST